MGTPAPVSTTPASTTAPASTQARRPGQHHRTPASSEGGHPGGHPAAPGICTSPGQPALAAALSRRIAKALRGTEATVGIAVGDSDEDFRCRYHQWRDFHSASVIKVITLGALLYQLQQEHESLGPDQAALATAMITESDNDAQDTLWNEIGMPALQAFLNAARMNHTVLGTDDFWGLTEVNAHDELRLLQLLITHNTVLDAASRRYALTLMADVIPGQRWGVPAGAPADMTVHLKNGWLPDPDLWDINSIGDFTRRDLDYSIAILTSNDPDMAYGVDTVEAIARLINRGAGRGRRGRRRMVPTAGAVPAPAVHAAAILLVNRATYHRGMPRRLAASNASDLMQAERDIRGRIGDQQLDFAAMAAVSNIYRAANVIRNHMERKVLCGRGPVLGRVHRAVRAVDLGRAADPGPGRRGRGHQGHPHRRAEDAGEARPGPAPGARVGRPPGAGQPGAQGPGRDRAVVPRVQPG